MEKDTSGTHNQAFMGKDDDAGNLYLNDKQTYPSYQICQEDLFPLKNNPNFKVATNINSYLPHPVMYNNPSATPSSMGTHPVPPNKDNVQLQPIPSSMQQMAQTNLPRGRLRVSKACDRCRTQKIKCSGYHPCTTCVKHKKECLFSSNQPGNQTHANTRANSPQPSEVRTVKRQKLDFSMTEPLGLPVIDKNDREGYVEHLENRVQYLEKLLSNNSNTNFKQPFEGDPPDPEMEKLLLNPSSKWRYSRRHQNLLIVDLCRSMYETLPEELRKNVVIPRHQYFCWNMSGTFYLPTQKLPEPPELDPRLNPRELTEFYFREINPLFAILHETVFREQIEAYCKLVGEQKLTLDGQGSKTYLTNLFTAQLYLVYTLAIRMTEMQRPKSPNVEILKLESVLFKYSYEVISILSFEWESFELIQGWLLITLYLRISHRQTSMYHALVCANAMTKSMGLGQDKCYYIKATPYERLKAKRIFWCVYTFDRLFGIQTGKYNAFNDNDRNRLFPTLDFFSETQRDDWISLPAFAMIHIAKIANYIHTSQLDILDLVKVQQINTELVVLYQWLNANGFKNSDLFKASSQPDIVGIAESHRNTTKNSISSLVKAQVKLHYYDCMMSVHGKILFKYTGRTVSEGLKVSMVVDACKGITEVIGKVHKAGLLFTPWYLMLLLLFNTSISAVALLHGGQYVQDAREILKESTRLLNVLMKSPVRNEKGKIIAKQRFTMVKECMWALKMTNHIMSLRFQEDLKSLNTIGTDHGSSDVNLQTFSQLGYNTTKTDGNEDEFNKLLAKQLHRGEHENTLEQQITTPTSSVSTDNLFAEDFLDTKPIKDIDSLLGNLQWFDQWLDFSYDL